MLDSSGKCKQMFVICLAELDGYCTLSPKHLCCHVIARGRRPCDLNIVSMVILYEEYAYHCLLHCQASTSQFSALSDTIFFKENSVFKENKINSLPTTISTIVFLVRPWISHFNIIVASILYKKRTATDKIKQSL